MCCFSGRADRRRRLRVENTRTFARRDGARQLLVYSMQLSADSDVAMILPLPVTPGGGEHAIEFVSLERCGDFFDELAHLFAAPALYFQRELPADYASLRAEEPRYVPPRAPWVPPFSAEEVAAMQRQARAHGRWSDRVRAFRETFGFAVSERPASHAVTSLVFPEQARCAQMAHLLAPDRHLFRHLLRGTLPNQDTWIADC
jgi:hypothetical protein